jgi:hypothetical protein
MQETQAAIISSSRLQQNHLRQEFVNERLQILKKARQITLEQSMQAGNSYKKDHHAMASQHYFKMTTHIWTINCFLEKTKNCSMMDSSLSGYKSG